MSPVRSGNRRTPRRRFHALHADILLVVALAAALAAALPAMRVASPERPVPGGFSAAVAPEGAGAAEGCSVASPLVFAFGARPDAAAAPLPAVPGAAASGIALRPAWEPFAGAADAASAAAAAPDAGARLPLPASSLLSDLSPAAPLFSEPRPAPPAPPPAPPAEASSVARFRDGPDAPAVVVVDAPGADPARLRELEAAAYAAGRQTP